MRRPAPVGRLAEVMAHGFGVGVRGICMRRSAFVGRLAELTVMGLAWVLRLLLEFCCWLQASAGGRTGCVRQAVVATGQMPFTMLHERQRIVSAVGPGIVNHEQAAVFDQLRTPRLQQADQNRAPRCSEMCRCCLNKRNRGEAVFVT